MNFIPKWINQIPKDVTTRHPQLTENHRKRIWVLICITVAIPVMVGYGIISWLDGNNQVDTILNFTVATCLFLIVFRLRKGVNQIKLYRFGMAVLTTLLVYNVGYGPYQESEPLWLFVCPIVNFYLFGPKEGLLWNTALILPSAILIIFPTPLNAYIYPIHFRIALLIAVMLILVLSYLLEILRRHFILQLTSKNIELENALKDVKKLSGLIPICSTCKKIRDDKGYWNQLEKYIHEHSEAQFSHGICPECAEKIYIEIENMPD